MHRVVFASARLNRHLKELKARKAPSKIKSKKTTKTRRKKKKKTVVELWKIVTATSRALGKVQNFLCNKHEPAENRWMFEGMIGMHILMTYFPHGTDVRVEVDVQFSLGVHGEQLVVALVLATDGGVDQVQVDVVQLQGRQGLGEELGRTFSGHPDQRQLWGSREKEMESTCKNFLKELLYYQLLALRKMEKNFRPTIKKKVKKTVINGQVLLVQSCSHVLQF